MVALIFVERTYLGPLPTNPSDHQKYPYLDL